MNTSLVLVEWVDAHSRAEWLEPADALKEHKPITCFNVGWILKRDREGMTIYSSLNNNNDVSELTFIPGGMIKKITVLKKARKAARHKG